MPAEKSVLAVIPARYASSRLPGKPLLKIHGRPMIWWVAKRVARSAVEEYVVATDDARIELFCKENHIPCMMTSTLCANGTERIAEVSEALEADYYINVQGDEPLINVDAINKVYTHIQSCDVRGFVQAIAPLDTTQIYDESVVKVAVSGASRIAYLSRSPIPFCKADNSAQIYFRCMGLYAYSGVFCRNYSRTPQGNLEQAEQIEQLRCIESESLSIEGVMVEDEGISIDTCQDYQAVCSMPFEKFALEQH